jgi:hypothetical protein
LGWFASTAVAGGELFELSAYPASPPRPRIVALAAIRALIVCGRRRGGLEIGTCSFLHFGVAPIVRERDEGAGELRVRRR